MKNLLIEAVQNGWVVREHYAWVPFDAGRYPEVWVYREVAELQAALPRLLGVESGCAAYDAAKDTLAREQATTTMREEMLAEGGKMLREKFEALMLRGLQGEAGVSPAVEEKR